MKSVGYIGVDVLFLLMYYSNPEVTMREIWVKGACDFSVLFLTTACESIIILKLKV